MRTELYDRDLLQQIICSVWLEARYFELGKVRLQQADGKPWVPAQVPVIVQPPMFARLNAQDRLMERSRTCHMVCLIRGRNLKEPWTPKVFRIYRSTVLDIVANGIAIPVVRILDAAPTEKEPADNNTISAFFDKGSELARKSIDWLTPIVELDRGPKVQAMETSIFLNSLTGVPIDQLMTSIDSSSYMRSVFKIDKEHGFFITLNDKMGIPYPLYNDDNKVGLDKALGGPIGTIVEVPTKILSLADRIITYSPSTPFDDRLTTMGRYVACESAWFSEQTRKKLKNST